MEKNKKEIVQELIKKYNVDIEKLMEEQIKLSKQLEIKDSRDFSEISLVAGVDSAFDKNKIISAVVVLSENMETSEKSYFDDKLRFPYLPGFRAYRELPSMLNAFNKLDEKPDLVFVNGNGISHLRLGIASQFSLATGIPTIGIAESLMEGVEADEKDIFISGKKVGMVLHSKSGSKPLFVSPGNLISIKTAYELAKKFIIPPHKLPEPLHEVQKYVKKVRNEMRNE